MLLKYLLWKESPQFSLVFQLEPTLNIKIKIYGFVTYLLSYCVQKSLIIKWMVILVTHLSFKDCKVPTFFFVLSNVKFKFNLYQIKKIQNYFT